MVTTSGRYIVGRTKGDSEGEDAHDRVPEDALSHPVHPGYGRVQGTPTSTMNTNINTARRMHTVVQGDFLSRVRTLVLIHRESPPLPRTCSCPFWLR